MSSRWRELGLAGLLAVVPLGCSDSLGYGGDSGSSVIALSSSSVAESAAQGTVIGVLTAPLAGGTVTFSLDDDAGGRFQVVGSDIRVAVASAFDYESSTSHTIIVRASDGVETLITYLSIQVLDVTEISLALSSTTVEEFPPDDTLVATITATDVNPGSFSYSLTDDSDKMRFVIGGNTLRIGAGYEVRASQGPYSITLRALNLNTLEEVSQTLSISVTQANFEIYATTQSDPVQGRPAIASKGQDYFLVWHEGMNLFGGRIDAGGQILDPAGILLGSTGGFASVAWDGTNYFVVWADPAGEVRAVRVSAAGQLLDSTPLVLTALADAMYPRSVAIAFDGTNHLVAWRTNGNRIMVTRISTSGSNLDALAGTDIGFGYYPWIAWDGGNYFVVWYDGDIRGRLVGTDGIPLGSTAIRISDQIEFEEHPSVVFGGTDYFVAWYSRTGGDFAFNDSAVLGARVTTGGVVLDDPPIEISNICASHVPIAVEHDGTDYQVLWQIDNQGTALVDVYSQGVSTAGALVGPRVQIAKMRGHQFGPRVGSNSDDDFLLVWSQGPGWTLPQGPGVWGHVFDPSNN